MTSAYSVECYLNLPYKVFPRATGWRREYSSTLLTLNRLRFSVGLGGQENYKMINCTKSGAEMEKDSRFCPECGALAQTNVSQERPMEEHVTAEEHVQVVTPNQSMTEVPIEYFDVKDGNDMTLEERIAESLKLGTSIRIRGIVCNSAEKIKKVLRNSGLTI